MKIDLNTSLKNNKHENSLTKTMPIYNVTVTKKQMCWNIEANSYEEAQELALEECELNSYKYYTYFDVDTVEEEAEG